MCNVNHSCRIFPENWLEPLSLKDLFDISQPLEIDVGCGKGRFLLRRATNGPETNFLGIERKLRRVRKIDKKAMKLGIRNLRLLRMDAYYAIHYYLNPSDKI
ncbi:MAG: methyltransferase domain-containing protein [Kiritimatiellae bacterium]|nr:methyltransferase domain-containing protein [Kiritimatiellia bacterium]